MQIVGILFEGVQVVGCPPRVWIWACMKNQPACPISTVAANSSEAKRCLMRTRPVSKLGEEVWKITQDELKRVP
eukprot:4805855-Karenia_brevis.AAC.1